MRLTVDHIGLALSLLGVVPPSPRDWLPVNPWDVECLILAQAGNQVGNQVHPHLLEGRVLGTRVPVTLILQMLLLYCRDYH